MEIKIRKETTADHEQVFRIHELAFERDNEAKLVVLLRKSPAFIPELSLVAEFNNEITGHILFTKNKIINETGETFESLTLAPVAVLPESQNTGIGAKLITVGLEEAAKLGFKSVIVLGHESYYPKFGFAPAENFNIRAPFDVPTQNFMAIQLVKDALREVTGTVVYPDEFSMA